MKAGRDGFFFFAERPPLVSLPLLLQDRSWKVRNAVAEAFKDQQQVVSPDVVKAELVPILRRLLQDQEAEVRTHAVQQLPHVGEHLPASERQVIIVTNLMAPITDICGDRCVGRAGAIFKKKMRNEAQEG